MTDTETSCSHRRNSGGSRENALGRVITRSVLRVVRLVGAVIIARELPADDLEQLLHRFFHNRTRAHLNPELRACNEVLHRAGSIGIGGRVGVQKLSEAELLDGAGQTLEVLDGED